MRLHLLLVALVFVGCSQSPEDLAKARLRGVPLHDLRWEAALLYRKIYSTPGSAFAVVPASQWPATFKQIAPMRVGAYRDGFALALAGEGASETGLHIVPDGIENPPAPLGAVRFEQITAGIYFYKNQPPRAQ